MNEENNNEVLEEEIASNPNDVLEEAIKEEMHKIQRSALLSGSKAICHVILGYIAEYTTTSGKKTFRQQERLIKRIRDFCETGISRTIDEHGEIVPIKKDVEDNTKLLEDEEN